MKLLEPEKEKGDCSMCNLRNPTEVYLKGGKLLCYFCVMPDDYTGGEWGEY